MKRTYNRARWAAPIALGILLGGVGAPAAAAPDAPSCKADIKNGQRPIILVHGLGGKAAAWGRTSDSKSMVAQLSALKNTYVETFDYSSKRKNLTWVTDPQIAPRLKNRVECLAKLSGKDVVLGGHSMGGLTIREVAKDTDDLGFIFTLGTPNSGSGWANIGTNLLRTICPIKLNVNDNSICDVDAMRGLRNNSDEIRRLHKHTGNTPLKAIAGDMTIRIQIGFATAHRDTDSDLVVSKQSALQFDAHPEQGGGRKVITCTNDVNAVFTNCWHSALTNNPTAVDEAVSSVERYIQYRDEINSFASKIKPYIGGWSNHSISTVVNANGTGTLYWHGFDSQPCGDDCRVDYTASYRVTLENDKFYATITSSDVTIDGGAEKGYYFFPIGKRYPMVLDTENHRLTISGPMCDNDIPRDPTDPNDVCGA